MTAPSVPGPAGITATTWGAAAADVECLPLRARERLELFADAGSLQVIRFAVRPAGPRHGRASR